MSAPNPSPPGQPQNGGGQEGEEASPAQGTRVPTACNELTSLFGFQTVAGHPPTVGKERESFFIARFLPSFPFCLHSLTGCPLPPKKNKKKTPKHVYAHLGCFMKAVFRKTQFALRIELSAVAVSVRFFLGTHTPLYSDIRRWQRASGST